MRPANNRKLIHWVSNGWGILYLLFVVFNFFRGNAYDLLVAPMSALYMGVLTIYVGSKEFDRWYAHHESRRRGELFVVAFSAVIFVLTFGTLVAPGGARLHSEIVATYIGVLTLFVITERSKRLYSAREHGGDGWGD